MEQTINSAFVNFINEISDKLNEHSILPWADKHFELKPFKLHSISMRQSAFSHEMILKKYSDGKIQTWSDQWHKNERKIFIQILLCFCKVMKKYPNSMENQDWQYLSSMVFNKNPMFLKFQAISLLKSYNKVLWTNTDDELINQFVQKCGQGNWNQVSRLIFYKTGSKRYLSPKQIRERWYNHISQRINKGPWTTEEDICLLEHVVHNNRHWCQIVKVLNRRRTEHMIKNRFKLLTKKLGNKNETLTKLIDELISRKGKSQTEDANKSVESESEIVSETIKQKAKLHKNSEIQTSQAKRNNQYQTISSKNTHNHSKSSDNQFQHLFGASNLQIQTLHMKEVSQLCQMNNFLDPAGKIWDEKSSNLGGIFQAPITHPPLYQGYGNFYMPNYFSTQSWPYYLIQSQHSQSGGNRQTAANKF